MVKNVGLHDISGTEFRNLIDVRHNLIEQYTTTTTIICYYIICLEKRAGAELVILIMII
jgi:hypothetical protein